MPPKSFLKSLLLSSGLKNWGFKNKKALKASLGFCVLATSFFHFTESHANLLSSMSNKSSFKSTSSFDFKTDKKSPSIFQADTLDYDESSDVITATGNVYIVQENKILRADKITYYQKTDKIIADGNVWLKDEDKNYTFAQYVELTNKMSDGFVDNIKILMTDDSRASANHSKRYNGEKMILWQGVYSPCPLCKQDPDAFPLWQLKSDKIIHDKESETLTYNHAWMEFFNIPVFYTPYFYHPDPTVKRKTGLLIPTYGSSNDLGASFSLPYYIVTGQNHDLTLYPTFTSKQGTLLEAEFRHRLIDGNYVLSGSYAGGTKDNNPKNSNVADRKKIPSKRWHVFFDGRYDVNDETIVKLIVRRASDLTYLKRFPVLQGGTTSVAQVQGSLDSSITVENFKQTSYGVARGYVFQSDDQDRTPVVLPTGTFLYESLPGTYNETWQFDANFLNLFRQKDIPGFVGEKMVRTSLGAGFQIPYVSPYGDIWKFQTTLRGDAYYIGQYQRSIFNPASGDNPNRSKYKKKDYNEQRFYPQASLTWRYPFIKSTECFQWITEPAMMVITSSHGSNPVEIPNEDSPLTTVEPTNLFVLNRFYGYDHVDNGHRFVYGKHNRLYFTEGRKFFFFFGQSVRLDDHQVLPPRSGEDKHASNFVSSILITPIKWFEARSKLMFDRKDWSIDVAETSATVISKWLTGSITHTYYSPNMSRDRQKVSQAIWTIATAPLYKWTASYSETINLGYRARQERTLNGRLINRKEPKLLVRSGTINYNHECMITSLTVIHEGYRDRDLKPDTKVLLQFNFKNLGTFSPINIIGSGSANKSTPTY